MMDYWEQYGWLSYLIAFAWAFFEGETFVLVASAFGKATGQINPWFLFLAVWLGSFAGDQCYFLLARRFGPRLLTWFPKLEPKIERVSSILRGHEVVFILCFRWWYGVRNVASFACGLSGIPWHRFAALNFFGAALWAASFVAAGWFLGSLLGTAGLLWSLFGIGAMLLMVFVARAYLIRRRNGRAV